MSRVHIVTGLLLLVLVGCTPTISEPATTRRALIHVGDTVSDFNKAVKESDIRVEEVLIGAHAERLQSDRSGTIYWIRAFKLPDGTHLEILFEHQRNDKEGKITHIMVGPKGQALDRLEWIKTRRFVGSLDLEAFAKE